MANGESETMPQGWMGDVQRAIALILIVTFAFVTVFSTVCSIVWPNALAVTDMAKSMQSNLTNMGLIALGFFFGSTMSKTVSDAGQQKIVEKLTSAPPAGPVAPVPSPLVPPEPWWNRLTDAERAGITASTDQRVKDFNAAPVTSKPLPDDLAYLVKLGLLTQDRATAIQAM